MLEYLSLFLLTFSIVIYNNIANKNKHYLLFLLVSIVINFLMVLLLIIGKYYSISNRLFLLPLILFQLVSFLFYKYHIKSLIVGYKLKFSTYDLFTILILFLLYWLNYLDFYIFNFNGNLKDFWGIPIENAKHLSDLNLIKNIFLFVYSFQIIRFLKNHSKKFENEKNITSFKNWTYLFVGSYMISLILQLFIFYRPISFNHNTIMILTFVSKLFSIIFFLNYFLNPLLLFNSFGRKQVATVEIDIEKHFLLDSFIKNDQYFLKKNILINDVSKNLNLSEAIIREIIFTNHKLNFNNYINNFRIIFALDKIENHYLENQTIESLSHISGFNSTQSFYRAFKKIHTLTPKEYYIKFKKAKDLHYKGVSEFLGSKNSPL